MFAVKVLLVFPPALIDKPITYYLVKDFELQINILRGKITHHEEGKLVIELKGQTQEQVEQGLIFLTEQGIDVTLMKKNIQWDEEKCVHCGACTAVCPSHAFELDSSTWRLNFNSEKCLACELCVKACPLDVIHITI